VLRGQNLIAVGCKGRIEMCFAETQIFPPTLHSALPLVLVRAKNGLDVVIVATQLY
jgi:hypothetical protein